MDGICALGVGELKEQKGSHIQGNLLTNGAIGWDRRASGGVRREQICWLGQKGQSEIHTDGLCHIPEHPCLGHVPNSGHGGWVLGLGDWRTNVGRTTPGCKETA